MKTLNNSDLNNIDGGFFWEILVGHVYVHTAITDGFDAANCMLLGYADGLTGGDHSDLCGG